MHVLRYRMKRVSGLRRVVRARCASRGEAPRRACEVRRLVLKWKADPFLSSGGGAGEGMRRNSREHPCSKRGTLHYVTNIYGPGLSVNLLVSAATTGSNSYYSWWRHYHGQTLFMLIKSSTRIRNGSSVVM